VRLILTHNKIHIYISFSLNVSETLKSVFLWRRRCERWDWWCHIFLISYSKIRRNIYIFWRRRLFSLFEIKYISRFRHRILMTKKHKTEEKRSRWCFINLFLCAEKKNLPTLLTFLMKSYTKAKHWIILTFVSNVVIHIQVKTMTLVDHKKQ
jgi:hypothetical protein